MENTAHKQHIAAIFAFAALTFSAPVAAQTLLPGNYSIDGNLCVGPDCTSSENYPGQSPLNIKDNNVGIYFEDTSDASSSFPFADWEIKINDTANGGENYFAIRDVSSNANILHIENSAPDNSLYVADNGDIGLGTRLPQVELHIYSGDTPTVRLSQDGSMGALAQSWQMSGNENSFRITDNTAGPTTPFFIDTGAPSAAIFIQDNGNVGMGTAGPAAALHVRRSDGTARVLVENFNTVTSAVREMFTMRNNGGSYFTLDNTQADTTWFFSHENAAPNRFIISDGVTDGPEMTLTAGGDLTIQGNFFANGGSQLNVPDYVFSSDYTLRPLAEVASFIKANSHLPDVPSAHQIAQDGLNMTDMQMTLLKKVEELTLYTLAQERVIADLTSRLEALE